MPIANAPTSAGGAIMPYARRAWTLHVLIVKQTFAIHVGHSTHMTWQDVQSVKTTCAPHVWAP
jgi:hypothetical protein